MKWGDRMLTGRKAELKFLDQYYQAEESRIVVVYGQKNIGKTALLKAFKGDRPGCYYLARAASAREQLFQWSNELRAAGLQLPEYPQYRDIFGALPLEGNMKRVLVLDEFHHMVKADPAFMPALVKYVEDCGLRHPVLAILCTSASGWVENSMVKRMGENAFYLKGLLKIKELQFEEMCSLYPEYSFSDALGTFAVLGGFPGLWKSFDSHLSIRENIIHHILTRESRLYEEMNVLMAEELREPAIYNTILASLAGGGNKLNDIYRHTGFSRAKISVYLKNLMELELAEKIFSIETAGRANVKKGIYRIANPFVSFYFRFLYPHQSLLQSVTPQEYYDRVIKDQWQEYTQEAFRRVCGEHLQNLNRAGRLPIRYNISGEWAGKSGNIDFVARDEEGRTLAAICSCGRPLDTADFDSLKIHAAQARIKPDYFYFFSSAGFTNEMQLLARKNNRVTLCLVGG